MNMRSIIIFVSFLMLTGSYGVHAQDKSSACPAGFYFLNYTNQFPEDLLSGKSVVFVNVPYKNKNHVRGDWESLAEECHGTFKSLGVDPVAYYNRQDIYAGQDVVDLFAVQMKQREINNVIFIRQVKSGPGNNEKFQILISNYNARAPIIANNQQAWIAENENLNALLNTLESQVSARSLERGNFLISEQPEYFSDIKLIRGNRFERYMPDLKLDKIAVPAFTKKAIPENYAAHPINEAMKTSIQERNRNTKALNDTLRKIMDIYPYEYGIVSDSLPEEALNNEGYQFVLRRVHTTIGNIKTWMDYKKSEGNGRSLWGEEGGKPVINLMDSLPDKKVVYKYYVKHIYTGDVYLGNTWDGAIRWQEALRKHWKMLNEALETGS